MYRAGGGGHTSFGERETCDSTQLGEENLAAGRASPSVELGVVRGVSLPLRPQVVEPILDHDLPVGPAPHARKRNREGQIVGRGVLRAAVEVPPNAPTPAPTDLPCRLNLVTSSHAAPLSPSSTVHHDAFWLSAR